MSRKFIELFSNLEEATEREPSAQGYIWGDPGGYKYGDLTLQVGGVSRIGTIKYGPESHGTALARTSSNGKLQTSPLVREGATK
jgi:hypothetical protein